MITVTMDDQQAAVVCEALTDHLDALKRCRDLAIYFGAEYQRDLDNLEAVLALISEAVAWEVGEVPE